MVNVYLFMKKYNRKYILLGSIFLVCLSMTLLFTVDFGVNSKYFIKKTFNNAFNYRITWDCISFGKYFVEDWWKWATRCDNERRVSWINTFSIKKITHNFRSNTAFLQAELTRNWNKSPYTASYELKRIDWRWLINNKAN